MKVTIFYANIYYYVTSFHPKLLNELVVCKPKITFVDVSTTSFEQVEDFAQKSDIVIIDNSIIWCIQKDQHIDFYFYIQLESKQYNSSHYAQITDYLFELEKRKLFWFHGDSHGLDVSRKNRLDGLKEFKERIAKKTHGIIIAMHPNKFEKELDKFLLDENFIQLPNPRLNIEDITRDKIIIEMPHCVAINEALDCKKKWDICIPGVSYKTRRIAEESLENHSLNVLPFKKIARVKYYFDVIVNKFLSTKARNELGYRFIRRLSATSRINFICGSGYKYFVRKFLEIPLYNSAMICYPVKNMEDYGFINGKHAIFCQPEELGTASAALLKNPALIEDLAKNAFNLVATLHTVTARASQFQKAIELLAADKLVASYFKDGAYFYETK